MNESGTRVMIVLRATLFVDAVVFLTAALLNFGAHLPLGFAEVSFADPIWQAGIGEAVIGLTLLAAAASGRTAMAWVALVLSVAGIILGLSSARVQGLARDIHVILVPLAVIIFGLLVWVRQQHLERHPETISSHQER